MLRNKPNDDLKGVGRRSAFIFCLLFLSVGACVQVESGEVGVKTRYIFDRGIQPEALGAQKHLVIPFFERLDIFSIREQKLDLVAGTSEEANRPPQPINQDSARQERLDRHFGAEPLHGDAVRLKTSDGNDVYVDVTVIFQLVPEQAPMILRTFGPEDQPGNYFDTLIRPTSRSVLRSTLGELTTEEFYNAKLRQSKAEQALAELRSRFSPFGFQVLDVLVREFRFNDDYQRAIEEKKLADQQAEENKSLAQAAEQDAVRKKNAAIGKANAMIEEAKGFLEKTKLEADAHLYAKKKEAEGYLAFARANAEGQRLAAEAMEGAGGKTLVAKTIAEKLQGKRIIMLPTGGEGGLQVTNINDLLSQFAATEALKPMVGAPTPAGK